MPHFCIILFHWNQCISITGALQTGYVLLLNHQGSLNNSFSPVKDPSWQCCTKPRWLVQVTTWVWALTNRICSDRRLLLRHLRGFKKKKRERNLSLFWLHHFTHTRLPLHLFCFLLVCLWVCALGRGSACLLLAAGRRMQQCSEWCICIVSHKDQTLPHNHPDLESYLPPPGFPVTWHLSSGSTGSLFWHHLHPQPLHP